MNTTSIFKTRSAMTMTKAEALRIQAEQVAFYSRSYGPKGLIRWQPRQRPMRWPMASIRFR